MEVKTTCPSCGFKGLMGTGREFEPRGKYDGFPIFICTSCKSGMRVKNAGRAKGEAIPQELWRRMGDEWNRNFPDT